VLFAHGSRFGGHALYVKDNRLHYVNNFVGMAEQKIDGSQDVPTGENMILSASFDKDGEDPPTCRPGSCPCTRRQEGLARAGSRPSRDSSCSPARPVVGRDSGEAVTDDYPNGSRTRLPAARSSGSPSTVSGDPYVDLEREAQAMLMRE